MCPCRGGADGTLAQRTTPLDPLVDKALQKAAAQGVMMHEVLGKEIWSIGWDVMVRDGVPYFIEYVPPDQS